MMSTTRVDKCLGCLRDTVYEDTVHLYNSTTRNCLHVNYLTVLRHIKLCAKVGALVGSLMMIRWGSKRIGIFNVIYYEYLRNNIVYFVGLSVAI
jgi:hypothetical protein